MVFRIDRRGLGGWMIAGMCVAMMFAHVTAGAQSDEATARQLFQSGQSLLGRHQYKEAVDAFTSVLSTAPRSAVADDALYEIARYQFEILADTKTADASADRLLKDYADSDSAPRARVLKGRVALATAATPEQLNAAVAAFDRLAQTSGDSPAAAEARYYAADAIRMAGRRDEAIGRYDEVARRYAASPTAPRALLASAPLLVAGGQAVRALEVLQRVRNRFPTAPEAAAAGDAITLLYRFYIRAPAQPPYAYGGSIPAGDMKIRDFRDLDVGAANHLFVATKSTLVEFGAKGEVVSSTDAPNSRGLIIDRDGRPITITEDGGLRMAGQPLLSLTTTRQDGRLEPVHLDSGVVTSSGTMIVTNRDQKTVVQFSSDGKPKGDFARMIAARRLAVDGQDQVAALDGDTKSVVVFGRDGHVVTRIPERGTGYQFKQPVDVAFDRLGHLYVLDRAAIFVFTPQSTLLTTISIPEKTPGSFANAEALALDSAARLFVFDSRAAVVQVYR
jgi:TolA-binding protein